jgi:hypothetical protein
MSKVNDMWLEIDIGNLDFERAIVDYVQIVLAQHYFPFANIKVDQHC